MREVLGASLASTSSRPHPPGSGDTAWGEEPAPMPPMAPASPGGARRAPAGPFQQRRIAVCTLRPHALRKRSQRCPAPAKAARQLPLCRLEEANSLQADVKPSRCLAIFWSSSRAEWGWESHELPLEPSPCLLHLDWSTPRSPVPALCKGPTSATSRFTWGCQTGEKAN